MSNELEDVDLAGDSFDVGHIDNLLLNQDLDGDPFASEGVSAQLDLAESAFADGLA